MEYLNDLKQLINGEMVTAIQYRIFSEGLTGTGDFNYIKDHCHEHSEEELEHYSQLVTALMSRGETPDFNLSTILKDCNPPLAEITGLSVDAAKAFFIKAEDDAVKAYTDFHNKIADADPDLDDIITGIISDEREHALDFSRLNGNSDTPINPESETEDSENTDEEKESEEPKILSVEDLKKAAASFKDEEKTEDEDEKKEESLKPRTEYDMLEERLHRKTSFKNSFKKFIEKLDG